MVIERLAELGYTFEPAPLLVLNRFHAAVRVGNLVFTSGQIPALGDVQIKGKVGKDLDMSRAQKAAEVCTVNCLRAVGTVADVEKIERIVRVLGMVNVADGFDDTSGVINGCSDFLGAVLGERGAHHARSAVGMVLPSDWAVEVEMIVAISD